MVLEKHTAVVGVVTDHTNEEKVEFLPSMHKPRIKLV